MLGRVRLPTLAPKNLKECAIIANMPLRSCGKRHPWCKICRPDVRDSLSHIWVKRPTSEEGKLATKLGQLTKAQERAFRKFELWVNGDDPGISVLTDSYRDFLLRRAGYVCSQCPWEGVNSTTGRTTLQIDHIDGDSENNRYENLRVLCPNCHSMTPTFGRAGGRRSLAKREILRKAGRIRRGEQVAIG